MTERPTVRPFRYYQGFLNRNPLGRGLRIIGGPSGPVLEASMSQDAVEVVDLAS